jgi:EF hand domain-containing protein
MQIKSLSAALVVAAFAVPLSASADTGKTSGAESTSAQPASTNASNDGGAEAMFKALDKNGDGFISREEAMGTPHAADFSNLDKNGDGKLSREEHAAAKEHAAARSGANSTGSTGDTSGAKKTY